MKENKEIQPIDELFRQSLEGHSPPPPPGVWKKIRIQLGKGGTSPWQFLTSSVGIIIVSAVILIVAGLLVFNTYFSATPLSETGNVITSSKIKTQGINNIKNSNSGIKTHTSKDHAPSVPNQLTGNPAITPSSLIALSKSAKPGSDDVNSRENPIKSNPSANHKNAAFREANITDSEGLTDQRSNKLTAPAAGMVKSGKVIPVQPEKNATSSLTDNLLPENLKNNLPEVLATLQQEQEKAITSETGSWGDGQGSAIASLVPVEEKPAPETGSIPEEGKVISSSNPEVVWGNNHPGTSDNPGISDISHPPANSGPAINPNLSHPNPFSYSIGIIGSIGQVLVNGLNPNNFYSVNVLAGISHKKLNAGIETGIGYTQYKDRGIFEFEYRKTDTTGYKGYSLFNAYDSSYLFVFKPVTSNRQIFVDTNTRFSYTYLKVPLYFTKQIFQFGQLDLGIKTGPSCDMLITRKEVQPEYSLPGSQFISLKNNSNTMLSTSWQWLVAPQISWNISNNLFFRFEPAIVFYLNNLYNTKDKPLATPYGIGIWTGLWYRF